MYSMDELTKKVGKTRQAIYNLIKTDAELSSIVSQSKVKQGQSVKYGEDVLQYLIKHYNVSVSPDGVGVSPAEPEAEEVPEPTRPQNDATDAAGDASSRTEIEALQKELEVIQKAYEALQAAYDKTEAERADLVRQNGILALTLQQVQQEKMLYLPAPKKPFSQRMMDLFRRK